MRQVGSPHHKKTREKRTAWNYHDGRAAKLSKRSESVELSSARSASVDVPTCKLNVRFRSLHLSKTLAVCHGEDVSDRFLA